MIANWVKLLRFCNQWDLPFFSKVPVFQFNTKRLIVIDVQSNPYTEKKVLDVNYALKLKKRPLIDLKLLTEDKRI